MLKFLFYYFYNQILFLLKYIIEILGVFKLIVLDGPGNFQTTGILIFLRRKALDKDIAKYSNFKDKIYGLCLY